MELENLQSAIERSWVLHDKISDVINSLEKSQFHLHWRCNKDQISETESLRAIRDAMGILENLLQSFQKLQLQQNLEQSTARQRLEESRVSLIKRIREHHGRAWDVIQERNHTENLNSSKIFTIKAENRLQRKQRNGFLSLLLSSIQIFRNSWKLRRDGGVVVRFFVVAGSMISVLHLQQMLLQLARRGGMVEKINISDAGKDGYLNSKAEERMSSIQFSWNSSLDVLNGRG